MPNASSYFFRAQSTLLCTRIRDHSETAKLLHFYCYLRHIEAGSISGLELQQIEFLIPGMEELPEQHSG